MPPKRNPDDGPQNLKEKLQNLQNANARGRRNAGMVAANGSTLKEVDNASTNSGQTSNDSSSSNVSLLRDEPTRLTALPRLRLLIILFSLDQMVFSRDLRPPGLPKSIPSRYSVRLQESSQPRRPQPRRRAPFAHHGTSQVQTTSPQRSASIGSQEEF